MSSTRIFLIASLLAAAIAAAFMAYMHGSTPNTAVQLSPPHCEPYANRLKLVGLAMTPRQVEEGEIKEAKRLGIVLEAPFGSHNNEWVAFKNKLQSGDLIFKYSGGSSGGYAIVRGNCVLDTLMTWIS